MKITHYTILERRDTSTLCEAVREAMKKGWQPLGGVAVYIEGSSTYYSQALAVYSD